MGKQFTKIGPQHRAFIERQKIFFVASAPPKGCVNVSSKGLSSLRVLGGNDVAYLDCTGSGSETRAHLIASDDKRLTIMFCAFEGDPVILRLYGQGESLMRGTPEYAALLPNFEEIPGARQIVRLAVDLVQNVVRHGRASFRLQRGARQPRSLLVGTGHRQSPEILGPQKHEKHRRSADGIFPGQHGPAALTLSGLVPLTAVTEFGGSLLEAYPHSASASPLNPDHQQKIAPGRYVSPLGTRLPFHDALDRGELWRVGGCAVWIEFDAFESIGERMVKLAEREVGIAALGKGGRVGRLDFEAARKKRDRPGVIAVIGVAVDRRSPLGLQLGGPEEIRHGMVVLADAAVELAAPGKEVRVGGLELNGLGEIGGGAREVAGLLVGVGAEDVGPSLFGVPERVLDELVLDALIESDRAV